MNVTRTAGLLTALLMCAAPVHAVPIVGNTYLDGGGTGWQYVGSFRVVDGPLWFDGQVTYNGLEAATLIFGALGAGSAYATSTLGEFVNHLAWYDGYGQVQHLMGGSGGALAENYNTDPDNDGYRFEGNGLGDFSAYIRDHVTQSSNSINYVFKRSVAVPEPASLSLIGFGLLALGWARRKHLHKQL